MVPTLKTSRSLLLALLSNHPSHHYLRQSISQHCLLHWLRCLHLHLLAYLQVHLVQYSKCETYRSLVLLSRRLLALQRSSRISLRSRFSPSPPSNERPLKLPTNSYVVWYLFDLFSDSPYLASPKPKRLAPLQGPRKAPLPKSRNLLLPNPRLNLRKVREGPSRS